MAKKPAKAPENEAEAPQIAAEAAENWPDADLIREIRAKTRDFSVFEAEYPSIALAAAHIGPVLGLGPINTAEAILLWQHWIGRE